MYKNPLLYEYEPFETVVENIRNNKSQRKCLGGGCESTVYEGVVDGKKYAVKFALPYTVMDRPRDTFRATIRKIDAGLRGLRHCRS